MTPDVKSFIVRRTQRYRVNSWSKEEALAKAKKGEDTILLTDKWS